MKSIKYIVLLLTLTFIVSCSDEVSIQQFYVESENNDDYLMIDIPTSIISLPEGASAESKQAYNSISKVNLLAFKINDTNRAKFETEFVKVKAILKNPSYIELMRLNSNGHKVMAKYIGTETAMEELILFASDKDKGFALARVLGDDMKPENMLKLLNNLKEVDVNNETIGTLKEFLK